MRLLIPITVSLITFFTPAQNPILINGAGATFPYILYSKWFYEYSKINTQAKINYRSIGSGGGIRQLIKGTLDFGASDIPMKEFEIKKSQKPIVHIPATLSAVVITYNLPQITQPLKLDSELIALIFSGKIKKWNDPKLQALNPDITLPEDDMFVVYRADGSGTTAVFTEYLYKTQQDKNWNIGQGKSVNWPIGIGGKGNEGVLGIIQKTKGSIAYLGMGYALQHKLQTAHIKNKNGRFIQPNKASVQKATQHIKQNQPYTQSIVNSANKEGYPISAFSFLLIYQEMDELKGKILVDFLNWALKDGQSFSESLYYVPLPENIIKQAQKNIQKIKIKSKIKKDEPS